MAYWAPGADGYDLIIARADLSGARTVSSHNAQTWGMAWSPDGGQLVYASSATNVADIYIVAADSGDARQLTSAPGYEVPNVWSPDGHRISYNATREGEGVRGMILDIRTGQSSTLRNREAPVCRWSPDGKWIAFISNRGRQTDVWVVPAAGGAEIRITDDPAEENNLQWVGSRLSYHTGSTGNSIWAVSPAGGAERRLTADSIETGEINPSPDGTEVAYEVIRGGGVSELRVMPIAGGASHTVATGSSINTQPSWSPDGRSLARLLGRHNDSLELGVIDMRDGSHRLLTRTPESETSYWWTADDTLLFTRQWTKRRIAIVDLGKLEVPTAP